MRILGGVISAISEAAAQYNPEPPPPRSHYSNIEANESEEVRQFRKLDAPENTGTETMNPFCAADSWNSCEMKGAMAPFTTQTEKQTSK